MKIYEVIPKFKGTSHVVVARNANEAIEITVEYLNQCNTVPKVEASDFYVSATDVDKFLVPTIIV